MSLSPGARLGPYEIVAAIGAGGMGEVYRARDNRLKRDVAIKILPDAFAGVLKGDPDWDALPVSTPSSVVRLLRRCLEKDRKNRLAGVSVE